MPCYANCWSIFYGRITENLPGCATGWIGAEPSETALSGCGVAVSMALRLERSVMERCAHLALPKFVFPNKPAHRSVWPVDRKTMIKRSWLVRFWDVNMLSHICGDLCLGMPENEPFEMLVTAKQSIDLKYMSDISGRFNVKSSLILSISIMSRPGSWCSTEDSIGQIAAGDCEERRQHAAIVTWVGWQGVAKFQPPRDVFFY